MVGIGRFLFVTFISVVAATRDKTADQLAASAYRTEIGEAEVSEWLLTTSRIG